MAPEFTPQISAVCDKFSELGIGHRRARNPERGDFDRMGPLLVVKRERRIRGRAQLKDAAGYFRIAGKRSSARQRQSHTGGVHWRRRVSQRLPHVGERFSMHVLMEYGKQIQVGFARAGFVIQPSGHALQDTLHIQKTNSFTEAYADREALMTAIQNLPPSQRSAVEMLKLQEMSLKEASIASGMSIGALKAATHRAMMALRKMLVRNP
jgi:RNA polymerase sigma-70 factor (ECF subfamily)